MRALAYAVIGILTLTAAGAANAQQAMKPMPGMSMSPSGMKHGQGTGVIKAKPALLKGLKVGQTVDFDCDVAGMSGEVTAVRLK